MKKIIYFIILWGTISSCNNSNRQYTRQLEKLDSQLEANSEMVWDSLKKMNASALNESQQAYYNLLNATAIDKNLIYLASDSTLNTALEYYKDHKDFYNLARCQYYTGKYIQKREKIKEAYTLFKHAESSLKQSKKEDVHLLGLIYYQLGHIQKQQNNLVESEAFFQKSFEKFCETHDTISAVYALRYKGIVQVSSKNYKEAEQNLFESLKLISSVKEDTPKILLVKNSVLSAISHFYRKTKRYSQSIEYGKKCLQFFNERNKEIPSEYYQNILIAFQLQNQIDSAKFYCNKMISTAQKEGNIYNLTNGYNILSSFAEKADNYKEAYMLKKQSSNLKDSINESIANNDILELEKKHNTSENKRLLLKAENAKLRAYALVSLILFTIIIAGLLFYVIYKKLKSKYNRLSETAKRTEWGFEVTKDFITENHIAYDELERMLNREKSLNNINTEIYNKFHDALIQQKADYSGRLFDRLTNFNGIFGTKFQKLFPEFSTDELLMATMIHHQWKITDMMTIFRVSVEAIRKRRTRLAHKISTKLGKEVDLEDFLRKL